MGFIAVHIDVYQIIIYIQFANPSVINAVRVYLDLLDRS